MYAIKILSEFQSDGTWEEELCDVRIATRERMCAVKHNRHLRFFVVLGLNILIIQFIALMKLY